MKRLLNYFSTVELCLWGFSVLAILISFFCFEQTGYLSLGGSLVGITSLILCAKGHPLGMALGIVFSIIYSIISYSFSYYGEMITYLGMSTPIAIFSIFTWLRHPYKDSDEVEVHKMTRRECFLMWGLAAIVTTAFYFILKALGNANLPVSTVSVTTSFVAAYLAMMRNPFYAVAYTANDIVLIVLWVAATLKDISYFPMVVCFVIFILYDLYGFYNWRTMQKRQRQS